ncbi:protein UXT-like [Tubulanus polymorphus]|uniref:protein UXT-like n=1 Tax=Tubulanus polymorphus TaxID=672921 RepID=UPI003DA6952D
MTSMGKPGNMNVMDSSFDSNLPQKVYDYEDFLNNVLQVDLKKVLETRDALYEKISTYLELKNTIEMIKEADTSSIKTKVDLGCNFYVQANVPDTSRIFVAVGFGFFVEFTLDEALKFIEKKTKHLNEEAEKMSKDSSKIKAHIKLVLEGLRELQHIKPETRNKQRDLFS